MWYWFVKTGWLYGMIIMGIVLAVQLIVKWKDWSVLRKLGTFTVIVLVFHVWEEWVSPGGFHYFYNISSEAVLRDRYPMNELTDIILHSTPEKKADAVAEFDEMLLISKCHSKGHRYPVIKQWFLAKYPEIKDFGTNTDEKEKAAEQTNEETAPSEEAIPENDEA